MTKFRRKGHSRSPWVDMEARETGLLSYKDTDLAKLEAALAGHVQQPGYPGYNDDRMVFMHTYQHYPQLIIHADCETDIVHAIRFAHKRGLRMTARSGGHSTAGYSSNDQIVLDTSSMNHVIVDPEARTARVGPGCTFAKLNRVLHHYDLHVPGGGCETVCVAGYMMGGGYGFTSRIFGMNCDHVTAIRMVTPKGQIVTASQDENADLFWAVRGGTGNQFGVLTEITYRLHAVGKFQGFGLSFPLHHPEEIATAARVLETLQAQYSQTGDPKMGHQALLMYLPKTAEQIHDLKPYLLIRGLYDGTEAQCRAALGPLMAHLTDPDTQVELWTREHYLHLNEALLMTVNPPGLEMPNVSMNTKPLVDCRIIEAHHPAERWQEMLHHFLRAPDTTTFIAMEFYGGLINEPAPDAMAFQHRRASMDIFSWAFWTFEDHKAASVAWLDGFGEIAGAMGNGCRYQNYPRRGNPGYAQQYFGDNLPRLQKIKQAYDPDGLLLYEQSIPLPKGGA